MSCENQKQKLLSPAVKLNISSGGQRTVFHSYLSAAGERFFL
jgi:hypothetical protein